MLYYFSTAYTSYHMPLKKYEQQRKQLRHQW
jgi:hypothetical protein